MFAKGKARMGMGDEATPSIIGASMRVTGDLKTDGDIHVDGSVEGDIYGRNVTIGETAIVKGEVVCEHVDAHGKVLGLIRAREVVLHSTAQISGDIMHETLEIARGAIVEGMLKRWAEKDSAEQRQPKLVVTDGEAAAGSATNR